CRTLDMRPVPLPDAARVWVVDSKKPRELAASGYAERRATCEAVAARLGVRALRDVSLVMLEDARPQLTPVAYKRARHIVTENARVLAMCDALENGALTVAGALLNTAHASLRDDYEISIPEIDFLCARIAAHPAGYGARIMGGGFGGSVVALVAAAGADDLARDVLAAYEGHYGLRAEGFVCTPAAGSACTVYRGA
ncbi:MAG: galactokinase, partial [Anaerolineales bacterium]